MKKLILPLLLAVTVLTSCSPNSGNQDELKIPTEFGPITNLIDAKKLEKDDAVSAFGVVAQFTYGYNTATSSNGKVGLYLVDNTSSMYVYCGHNTITNVEVGQQVFVQGVIDAYISQQEASQGEEIGYYGAQQIRATTVTVYDEGNTALPKAAIPTKTINELATTNFRDNDLSGTIFKVTATVSYMDVSGTDVYYFNDPSLDNSLYTYSTIYGAEFDWVQSLVGCTNEWLLAVHSLRSKDEAWRVIPVSYGKSVTITDDDRGGYAVNRTLKQFNATYNSTTSIKLIEEDVQLKEEATITYSTNSTDHTITTTADGTFLNIDATKLGKFKVSVQVTYKGKNYTGSRELEVVEKPPFDGVTCASVQTTTDGEKVKVRGIYMRTAANVTGVYIADETAILVVYYTADFNPTDYILGEELIFEGEVLTDFTNGGTHPGYKRLANAVLLSHDSTVHEWDKSLVAGEATINDIKDASDGRVNKIYKMTGIVKTVSTQYYSNKQFVDPSDSSNSLTLYCGNASQIAWLDDYEGQTVNVYMFIRDKKNGKLRIEILDIE